MQDCRDTFLQYLADNLQDITVHAVRQDKARPANALVQMNALNVQYLNSYFSVIVSRQYVALDVCADDERTALSYADAVADLLQLSGSIPKNHYASDGTITPTGGFLYWNPNAVNFKTVETGGECVRLNCLLVLSHNTSDL
jgi:hypothetical protein